MAKSKKKPTTLPNPRKLPAVIGGMEMWVVLRMLYESGRFSSCEQLRKYCAKAWGKVPSTSRILAHSSAENWEKGKNIDAIERARERTIEDLFAKHGLPREERVKAMVEGVLAGKVVAEKIKEAFEADGNTFNMNLYNHVKGLYEGKDTQLRWLKEVNVITGDTKRASMPVSAVPDNPEITRQRLKATLLSSPETAALMLDYFKESVTHGR